MIDAVMVEPQAPPTRAATRLDAFVWADVAAVAGLLALWTLLLAARWNALPLQLWDESRNADNALEMARQGHWLTPMFAGAVDHWNTKPPLLIWMMAGLMRLGVAPLLAVRAPSLASALACALGVWATLRFGARDRLAAIAGGVLLLCAPVFIAVHGASTGDFDAPESAAMLAYVVCAWAALETRRSGWIVAAVAALIAGVMTKGVAAALALPGVALYALCRPRALAALMRDPRAWMACVAAIAVPGAYYLGRERIDPGYLAAVAHNELGGRFLQVTEHHRGSPDFYLAELWRRGQPAAASALLAILTLAAARGPRRRLAASGALALGSLLLVLSISRSKMEWYAVPMVPPLALLAGLGLTQLVALAARSRPILASLARACVGLVLAIAVVSALGQVRAAPARLYASPVGSQYRYGQLFDALARRAWIGPVFVADGGLYNDAGFPDYNPMLRFDADLARATGLKVQVIAPTSALAPSAWVATCDPAAREELSDRYVLVPGLRTPGCTVDRVEAAAAS